MPRSDKFYVFLVVGLCSLLVIGSIIACIITLTGKPEERPAYESRPASALVNPDPAGDSILKVDTYYKQPPINDATYLLLHKQSRLFLADVVKGDWQATAREAKMQPAAWAAFTDQMVGLRPLLKGSKLSGKTDVVLYCRPQADPNQKPGRQDLVATTIASSALAPSSDSTQAAKSLSLSIDWRLKNDFWTFDSVSASTDNNSPASSSSSPCQPDSDVQPESLSAGATN